MITQSLHIRLASRCRVTARVRRSHICWILAYQVCNSALVLHHLLYPLIMGQSRKIVMGPCMRGYLMALGNHPLDNGWIWCRDIDGSFGKIIPRHEECCLETELFENIQHLVGILVRSVIVGQRDNTWLNAVVDIIVVGDFAQRWSRVVDGRRPGRRVVRVTPPKVELAIFRIRAVILAGATPARARTAFAGSTFLIIVCRSALRWIRIWVRCWSCC